MPDGSPLSITLMIICLAFSAFFSSTETAFTSFNSTKMKNLSNEGNRRASLVLRLSENYDKLLTTILVGNNIVNIALSSIATLWFVALLASTKAGSYASAISTAVTTVIVLIVGEVIPKSLARERPEKFAMAVAPLVRPMIILLTPASLFFALLKKLLRKVIKPAEDEAITESEVLTLVDEAHEDGSIDEYNKELIENIFDFDDLSAGEIATHRTDITMLAKDGSDEDWEQAINSSRFTRYPIYGENQDDIIGILDAKEYFRLEDKSRESIMEHAVKPAYFVPETVKTDVLFRNMKQKKESIAVVLDEYGGLRGIVTFTDLVECLVGEFAETDETEATVESIVLLEENCWQINGPTTVSDVEEAIGITIPECESDTFSGFVLGLYGSIPEDGSSLELSTEQMDIQVLEIREHRIECAILKLKKPEDEDAKAVKSESAV